MSELAIQLRIGCAPPVQKKKSCVHLDRLPWSHIASGSRVVEYVTLLPDTTTFAAACAVRLQLLTRSMFSPRGVVRAWSRSTWKLSADGAHPEFISSEHDADKFKFCTAFRCRRLLAWRPNCRYLVDPSVTSQSTHLSCHDLSSPSALSSHDPAAGRPGASTKSALANNCDLLSAKLHLSHLTQCPLPDPLCASQCLRSQSSGGNT